MQRPSAPERLCSYPVIPGHEIIGRVVAVGGGVTKFRVGQLAGVGCLVDSCRTCASCQEDLACALVFLALNGAPLHVPAAELFALTMAEANNQADDAAVAAYFRDRLTARS